uniref:Heparan sulfate 2-O-sulfotransferase pipe-like n=1 Tax=Hirondellea gigas TaxID=1518452 RepID=A0A6A7GCH2_9CRUS
MQFIGTKYHRNLGASSVCDLLRLLLYVLLVLVLKVFAVSLLLSSGLFRQQPADDTSAILENIPWKQQQTTPSIRTPEPGWHQKQEVLSRLEETSTSIVATASNRTPDTLWLFYNRIPRTGGHTLVALLQTLGADLDYQHQEHAYRTSWQRLLSAEEQKNLATWFEYNLWPKTYDRLALFVNFTAYRSSYERQRPATVTLLRDPIAQFSSQFHHRRTHTDTAKKNMAAREKQSPGSGRRWYWRGLEACVLEEDDECLLANGQPDFQRSIPFLCGQHQRCLLRGERWALQRAKFMVEYEYSVVGVLEEWNNTLAVLEHYLPAFLQGATQRYWSIEHAEDRHKEKNPRKSKPLSSRAIRVLKSKLGLEYELYEFCKQRLALQYAKVAPLLQHTTPLPPLKEPKKQLSAWDRFQIELNY